MIWAHVPVLALTALTEMMLEQPERPLGIYIYIYRDISVQVNLLKIQYTN
jgi:hypothetical protein